MGLRACLVQLGAFFILTALDLDSSPRNTFGFVEKITGLVSCSVRYYRFSILTRV